MCLLINAPAARLLVKLYKKQEVRRQEVRRQEVRRNELRNGGDQKT